MYTMQRWIKRILAPALAAIVLGYAPTVARGDYPTERTGDSWQWGVPANSPPRPQSVGGDLYRATALTGSPVKDREGKGLGTVHDLVLTPDFNSVSYVAVSSGGFLGIGSHLHAIPWSAVQISKTGGLAVPIDKQQFDQDRGFTRGNWPSRGNPRWGSGPGERTEQVAAEMTTPREQASIQQRRFTHVKGMEVMGPEGQNISDVRDLVIAADTGKIAYTVVVYGGFIGFGEKYAAVPTRAVTFQPQSGIARIDRGRQVLEANSFSPNAFPDLSAPRYARQLDQAYGVEGYQTVLGYVPAREPANGESTASSSTPTEADLTGTFDPAHVTTIEGTVMALGTYRNSQTGTDTLWLRVKADDGQIITVDAGPRQYVAGQDFYIVKGDRIRLTGSEVPAAATGRQVFLPTTITFGQNTLRLRDSNGQPLWQSPSKENQGQPPETAPGSPGQNQDASAGMSLRS